MNKDFYMNTNHYCNLYLTIEKKNDINEKEKERLDNIFSQYIGPYASGIIVSNK